MSIEIYKIESNTYLKIKTKLPTLSNDCKEINNMSVTLKFTNKDNVIYFNENFERKLLNDVLDNE